MDERRNNKETHRRGNGSVHGIAYGPSPRLGPISCPLTPITPLALTDTGEKEWNDIQDCSYFFQQDYYNTSLHHLIHAPLAFPFSSTTSSSSSLPNNNNNDSAASYYPQPSIPMIFSTFIQDPGYTSAIQQHCPYYQWPNKDYQYQMQWNEEWGCGVGQMDEERVDWMGATVTSGGGNGDIWKSQGCDVEDRRYSEVVVGLGRLDLN
ncbi:5806_t:CDS:2 [Paraglomus occultum]|uniref:5806_t:CDS:1 n=1 Tax=Paraglomus occultum TaxID=144539 RepID=A0A9N9A3K7_9GLOM|nr:5806_t:CDS:2 [Paraglomus occultum]